MTVHILSPVKSAQLWLVNIRLCESRLFDRSPPWTVLASTLVVPENSDVFLPEEFDHINVWATVNKMILNLIKTKETVFHRPGPKGFHMFPSVEGIELVEQVKLLGVILQNNLSVNSHVNYVLTLCSQRIFLLKRLRDQGLNYHQPDTVFRLL